MKNRIQIFDLFQSLFYMRSWRRFIFLIFRMCKWQRPSLDGGSSLCVPSNSSFVEIPYSSILYARADGDNVQLYLNDNRILPISMSLRPLLRLLPQDCFIRVHKSFVVSKENIVQFSCKEIAMANDCIVPVGRFYTESLWNDLL